MTELSVAPRRWTRWLWIPAAVAVLAVIGWWTQHPQSLSTSADTVQATAKVGQTTYVAVTGRGDVERELNVSDVSVQLLDDADGVRVEPQVCHGGSISTTTDPDPFCDSLEDAEGATLKLGGGDQLILAITADTAGTVSVKQVEVSYREGLQWGTQPVGPLIVVDVVG
jgi:hypothetical protein